MVCLEEDALEKSCPLHRNNKLLCIGGSCMAWVYTITIDEAVKNNREYRDKIYPSGFCGLARHKK